LIPLLQRKRWCGCTSQGGRRRVTTKNSVTNLKNSSATDLQCS
jgi:hypothetical protein